MCDEETSQRTCQVCGVTANLSQCSKCYQVSYCGKSHQMQDWKNHKKVCITSSLCKDVENLSLHTSNKASTSEMNLSVNPANDAKNPASQWAAKNSVRLEPFLPDEVTPKERAMGEYMWKQLSQVGIVILNDFLPRDHAEQVHVDVNKLYEGASFVDGEILKQGSNLEQRVRSDRITWVDEEYSQCTAVRHLARKLDRIIKLCSAHSPHEVEARTKPMVACYPGNGTHYKRHVDNPAGDGRAFTCLYYLNKEWNAKVNGGLLCLYPVGLKKRVPCEPIFNRLCVFFSDNRNPHEVLPSFKSRFAITCWYFDKEERRRALESWAQQVKQS